MSDVINWPFTIVFFISVLGLLVAVLLITVNKTDVFHNRLLAAYLGCFSLLALNYSLMSTRFFLSFPHTWRLLAWASFWFAPFGYLYVRSVLEQSFWFRRRDFIWFLPGIIHLLGMVPFLLLSSSEKLIILENIFANRKLIITEPESIFHEGVGVWMRVAVIVVSTIAQLRLLYKWRIILRKEETIVQNMDTYKWLVLFSFTMVVFSILIIFQILFHMISPADLNLLLLFTIAFTILFVSFYLLYKPSILYGLRGWITNPEAKENMPSVPVGPSIEPSTPAESDPEKLQSIAADKKKIYLSVEQGNAIRQVLLQHLEKNQPYRKTGYTISDLSNEISIPSYLLSAFINQEYGKNFNELVNEYRVDYFIQLVQKPGANEQFKLEALGREAGFNTRASFIRAVKKKTGLTPSDFVAKKEK